MRTQNPRAVKWRFSPLKKTKDISITGDGRIAHHTGSETGWQIALCEPSSEPNVAFSVRIARNPQQRDLHIGLSLPLESLDNNLDEAAQLSWQLGTGNHQLYERGKSGPCGRHRIVEGSRVDVERDAEKKALRFLVNGKEPVDKDGKSFGWRETGLSEGEFKSLVGCVWLWYSDDEVMIM